MSNIFYVVIIKITEAYKQFLYATALGIKVQYAVILSSKQGAGKRF